MKADLLEQEFRPRAVVDGVAGRPVLRGADMVELINRAADEGVPILGVTGFPADLPQPGEKSDRADFSAAVSQGHGCWQDAEAFIRAKGDRELVFEAVLGDDPIQAV